MPDTQAIARAQIVAAMAAARGQVMTADESIRRHNENTRAMFLASNPDTPLEEARDVLDAAITAANEYNTTQRLFHHRPGDGAIATNAVMHDLFGQLLGMKTWVQDPQQLSARRFEVFAEMRHREVEHGEIHRIEHAWERDHREAYPFATRRLCWHRRIFRHSTDHGMRQPFCRRSRSQLQ